MWQEQSPAIQGDTKFASSAKLRLTSRRPLFCFRRIIADQLQFTPDMKKLLTLTMLISLAMICSCQKQGSAAERQLGQRKAELDAREKELDEREKALAERERATAQSVPDAQLRTQARDPAQLKADRDRRLQQLPSDVRQLIPDAAQVKANRDARIQERLAQRQQRLQELEKTRGHLGLQHFLGQRLLRHLRWERLLRRRLLRHLLYPYILRPTLVRRLRRRRHNKSEPLPACLVGIDRQLRALFCKIPRVLERVDRIHVLIAPDCLYARETQWQSTQVLRTYFSS